MRQAEKHRLFDLGAHVAPSVPPQTRRFERAGVSYMDFLHIQRCHYCIIYDEAVQIEKVGIYPELSCLLFYQLALYSND